MSRKSREEGDLLQIGVSGRERASSPEDKLARQADQARNGDSVFPGIEALMFLGGCGFSRDDMEF